MKQYFFRRRLKAMPKRNVRFPEWKNIRSIALLYPSDLMEKNPVIHRLQAELQAEEKNIVLIGYVDKKDIISPILPQSRIYGQRHFTLLGTPTEAALHDLQIQMFDLLIDLSQQTILPLQYMAMYIRADFKAGMHLTDDGIHDLMIEMDAEDSMEHLAKEIVKYLKMIHSND